MTASGIPDTGARRSLAALVVLLATTSVLACVAASTSRAQRSVSAHDARTLSGADTAHLHVVHVSGAILQEEGSATGALPGHMRAQLAVGSEFTGDFSIYTRDGQIDGHGSATPHGAGRYQSFSGSLSVNGGSGAYAHVHGRTGLYGTFDRRTYAVVLETTGTLSY